jgi:hypothetical protein
VSIGYKFPGVTVYTNAVRPDPGAEPDPESGKIADKTVTMSAGAVLGFEAGGNLELNDTSSLYTSVYFGSVFPISYTGDTKDGLIPGIDPSDPWNQDGAWGLDFYLHYQKVLAFGNDTVGTTTVKLRPYLTANFLSQSFNTTYGGNDVKVPSNDWFTLSPGFNVALQYKYQKIALYSGFGLEFLKLNTFSHSGGETKNGDTKWALSGMEWVPGKLTGTGNFAYGMTFTPVDNLTIGIGLSNFVNNIFNFNLKEMTLSGGGGTGGAYLQNIIGSSVDLTVSYKY